MKALLEIWADSCCAPRARGGGKKLRPGVHDAADAPDLEPLRAEALKHGLPADRLAAEALLDPVGCRHILTELRSEWLLGKDLPDCHGFFHAWVALHPDDQALIECLPQFCALLARLATDPHLARQQSLGKIGDILGRLSQRKPGEMSLLLETLEKLEPSREDPDREWAHVLSLPPCFRALTELAECVLPVLFEAGFCEQAQALQIFNRLPGLSRARPDLSKWNLWKQTALWNRVHGLKMSAPQGVQRLLELCAQGMEKSWMLCMLPGPAPEDEEHSGALATLSAEQAFRISLHSPAWARVLEPAVCWPGLAALCELFAILTGSMDWRRQLQEVREWRKQVDLMGLRRSLQQMSPAQVQAVERTRPYFECRYWVEALLGRGLKAVAREVEHGRARGLLALALVPSHPHRPLYRQALHRYAEALSRRSPPVQEKGRTYLQAAIHWLDGDPVSDLALQVELTRQLLD